MTPNQGCGIKEKSKSDHLIRIINFIKSNKAKEQKPILAFLDVTKAYDKAWSKAIMYALDRSGIKLTYYFWLLTSGCSAVCLFSLISNCSPPLLVYCIFLGPRGETVALIRYHRRVLG